MRLLTLAVVAAVALATACASANPGGNAGGTQSASLGVEATQASRTESRQPLGSPAKTAAPHLTRPASESASMATSPRTKAAALPPDQTRRVVLRPVNRHAQPANGYTVTDGHPGYSLDCSTATAAVASLSRDVEWCFPTALSASTCWADTQPGHALCLQNPWSAQLVRFPTSGSFASVAATGHPRPLGITLNDGQNCALRDGGAGSSPIGKPNWTSYYTCGNGNAVWAAIAPDATGIDTSHPLWTVHVGNVTGDGPLVTRPVSTAYYVATAT